MPFSRPPPAKQPAPEKHITRTVIQKETIVREIPVQVLNASLDTLAVHNLNVVNFSVPDITVFHPKEPHILKKSFLDFSTDSPTIELRTNNTPFLRYAESNLYTNNVTVSLATVSKLRVGRIESTEGNEIGGVFLNSRSLTVPGSAYVGESFVAKEGAVGGVTFKDGRAVFTQVDTRVMNVEQLCVKDLSCAFPVILGDVGLSGGNVNANTLHVETDSCISGVRIHDCGINCDYASISRVSSHKFDIDNLSLSSFEDRLTVGGGIFTPIQSLNNIGCLMSDGSSVCIDGKLSAYSGTLTSIHTDRLSVRDVLIDNNTVDAVRGQFDTLVASNILCSRIDTTCVRCSQIDVSEVKCDNIDTNVVVADEYNHKDGSSILKDIIPVGMICLFSGEIPPRGWMLCDGRGGRPRLPSPAQGVIYMVRV